MGTNLPTYFDPLSPEEIDEIFTEVALRHRRGTDYLVIMTEVVRKVEQNIRFQLILNDRTFNAQDNRKLLPGGDGSGQSDGEERGVQRSG